MNSDEGGWIGLDWIELVRTVLEVEEEWRRTMDEAGFKMSEMAAGSTFHSQSRAA